MGKDDPKGLILARRAKFVAAALAGVTGVATACGGSTDETGTKNPEPCLGVACCPETGPEPCLTPIAPDAASDAGDASDAKPDDADAEPQPCLAPPPGDQ